MKKILFILGLLVIINFGCTPTQEPTADEKPNTTLNNGTQINEDEDTKDTYEGKEVIIGTLGIGKGGLATVDNVLVTDDQFFENFELEHPEYMYGDPEPGEKIDPREWRNVIEALEGKTVEIKGGVYTHYCDYNEQCTIEGYYEYMKNVEYLIVMEE